MTEKIQINCLHMVSVSISKLGLQFN